MGGTDSPLPALWDMDSADYECDCPGPPPPAFHLPPPPRPPFLHELADCSEAPLLDLETCDTMPVSILSRTGFFRYRSLVYVAC